MNTKLALFVLFVFAFLCTGCGKGGEIQGLAQQAVSEAGSVVEEFEDATGRDVDPSLKIGVELGLLVVAINQRGEIEVSVVAETPSVPTPLGAFSAFVEASIEFPKQKTLTIVTQRQTWVYDLNDRPFAVDLVDIDANVRGDGDGNLVIEVVDRRITGEVEPQFKETLAQRISMNSERAALTVNTFEIGRSVNGEAITVTQIGNGARVVVLVGGFHAGFAPASVRLAESMIDYFQSNPEEIPEDVRIYVIPLANPDSAQGGREAISGRVNGNGVDINRNWDCNWTENAVWRSQSINAGDKPFSEPESAALKAFFLDEEPSAVIFWEARGELVIPGRCGSYHSDSQRLASVYGAHSGYEFGFITGYQVTGDVSDWLDKNGIAAIAILLSGYDATDWDRNLRGVQDVLQDVAR